MKYKYQHPSKQLWKALGLSQKSMHEIEQAMLESLQGHNPNAAALMDEAINKICHLLDTPEKAFFAGFGLFATLAQTRRYNTTKN